jgi:hypothetical protein
LSNDFDNIDGRFRFPMMDQNAIVFYDRLTGGRRIACRLLEARGRQIHERIMPRRA